MSSQPVFPSSAAQVEARRAPRSAESARRRWTRWLEHLIFFFFLLFALALPHSVKGTHHAYEAES